MTNTEILNEIASLATKLKVRSCTESKRAYKMLTDSVTRLKWEEETHG